MLNNADKGSLPVTFMDKKRTATTIRKGTLNAMVTAFMPTVSDATTVTA